MTELSTTPDQALCYNNNNNSAQHQRHNTSPLEIPELLDKIFSYMDEVTLALSVIPVCRYWFQVGWSRVVREAVYDTDMTDQELEVVVMKQLPVARRVVLVHTSHEWEGGYEAVAAEGESYRGTEGEASSVGRSLCGEGR